VNRTMSSCVRAWYHVSMAEPNLSLGDVAQELGVNVRTVRRYIASGQLAAYRVGPRLLRVDRADLDAFVRRIPTEKD
jgi:excisionase family DNA binding protein